MKFRADLLLRSVDDEFYVIDPQQDMVDLSDLHRLTKTVVFLWTEFKGQSFTEDQLIDASTRAHKKDWNEARRDVSLILSMFRQHGFLEY